MTTALGLLFIILFQAPSMSVLTVEASGRAVGQRKTTSAKASPPFEVGDIRDPSVVEGCGCYFQLPAEHRKKRSDKYVFMEEIGDEGAWMNIDGRDMKLKLIGSTKGWVGGVGTRSHERFRASGIAVRVDFVVTGVCRPDDESCESTDYDATFTVTKAGRKRTIIKAKGICGC
jgi:hypothetical protein